MVFLKKYQVSVFGFLFAVLAIISLSTAIAAQNAVKAAKAADLIAQCTKPGTKCFTLQQQGEARRTAQNKCIIDTIIKFPPVPERQEKRLEILKSYDDCVTEFTKIVASTDTTNTTANITVPG